ncbi:MAG: phosphoribosyltransferase-like protein [Myxococcota bacterium]
MRDGLAERLLARVMNWTPEDVARERPVLQALAALKYDEYQQFSPGMRFVESLALWLGQFATLAERKAAYAFVLSRLVFLSHAEMAHFAAIAYPDVIRPVFIEQAAKNATLPPFRVSQVLGAETFKQLEGSSLFFGLSDGARVDLFRRSNKELSHEQIFTGYELSDGKVGEIRKWLHEKRNHKEPAPSLVLLDDFSASGTSCLTADGNRPKGKVAKFVEQIQSREAWKAVVSFPKTRLVVVLYVATEQALANINAGAEALKKVHGIETTVLAVQRIASNISLKPSDTDPMVAVINNEKYYDASVEDEHTKKGNSDLKFGFACGGLPLVLHHNTPNNSIFLLWVEGSETVRPLFPRVSRHRREA